MKKKRKPRSIVVPFLFCCLAIMASTSPPFHYSAISPSSSSSDSLAGAAGTSHTGTGAGASGVGDLEIFLSSSESAAAAAAASLVFSLLVCSAYYMVMVMAVSQSEKRCSKDCQRKMAHLNLGHRSGRLLVLLRISSGGSISSSTSICASCLLGLLHGHGYGSQSEQRCSKDCQR
jgi:hypothetical protein